MGIPFSRCVGVINKVDLASAAVAQAVQSDLSQLGLGSVFCVSSLNHQGFSDLTIGLIRIVEAMTHREKGELVLTRTEHYQAVCAAIQSLERARTSTQYDLFASDVRNALGSLNVLVGETVPDDILGEIFSKFCIGK
jgi:tRNA modification GTPase